MRYRAASGAASTLDGLPLDDVTGQVASRGGEGLGVGEYGKTP